MRGIWSAIAVLIVAAHAAGRGTLEQSYARYLHGDLQGVVDSQRMPDRPGAVSVDACLDLSVVLQDMGRKPDAIAALEDCVKTWPADVRLKSALAWIHFNEGDLKDAEAYFMKAAGKGSSGPGDLLGMARIALEEGRYDRASSLLKEMVKNRQRLSLAYYYQGKTYEAQRKWSQAAGAYQAVLKEDSYFAEVRPLLADVFEKQKQTEEAWRQYARIVAVDPGHRKALEGKRRLEALLAKKPEEIMPPKSIRSHSPVAPAPGRGAGPSLKIGIGTSSGGGLVQRGSLSFQAAGVFAITDPRSKRELAKGAAGAVWTVRIDPNDRHAAAIIDPQGKTAARFRRSVFLRTEQGGRHTFIVKGLSYAPGYPWGGIADRELRGDIEIVLRPERKTLLVINHIPMEEYLYGVLNSEMPTHWPTEALKAQAVLARTQVVYRSRISRPHRGLGYDLCDEQHCQVYGGVAAETGKARSVVDSTHGETLSYNGRPAHTVFFSNCGGHTQSGKEVGWADVPYWQAGFDGKDPTSSPRSPWQLQQWLMGTPAAYCNIPKYMWGPEFRWARVIPVPDLESRVFRIKPIGKIKEIAVLKRSRSGHVTALQIRGHAGELVIDQEHKIRRLMGLGALRSTLFVLETAYRDGNPVALTIHGGGWGHGVGMCQAGAGGRAEAGADYREIVRHYFPGTALQKAAE